MQLLLLLLFLNINNLCSQKNKLPQLGKTTIDELNMTVYDKDSSAIAVVLHESANLYLDPNHNYDTRTDFYFRIKILDKKGFEKATISIDSYDKKKIIDIRGITYNLDDGYIKKTSLDKSAIFKTDISEKWNNTKFTLPNIKEGSVIEYTYSQISPYSTIEDWYFQSDIPKMSSEYDAAILGNYKYNVRIIGFLKLDKDKPTVDKKCIYLDGIGQGQCLRYSYGMYNIPAFEEEDYMLSKKNYISRLSFDLESYTNTRGLTEKYTTTWKEADKKLKSIFFNNQTSKKGFFKRNLPEEIINEPKPLKRATDIYTYIKNHFTWNERYWSSEDEKVKDAFDAKTGSAGEINLALYNSLKAADLEASLVILSTRNHGIPTMLYPVIFDFNYVIVKTIINNKVYYLDATEKYLPFGQVPVRCLNGKAREINFNEDSNWIILQPKYRSNSAMNVKLDLKEDGTFSGKLETKKTGYFAARARKKINSISEEKYLEDFENDYINTEVTSYKNTNLLDLTKPLNEEYDIFVDSDEELTNKVRINPFKYHGFSTNPFKLKERNYPVDFAHRRSSNFYINITYPESYTIVQEPKNIAISLPSNGGRCIIKSTHSGNKISLYVRLQINKKIFSPAEYQFLKEFYNQIVLAEKSYLILEKKS